MKRRLQPRNIKALAFASIVALSTSAMATEGGGSIYSNGIENYMSGAVPPVPGVYFLLYGSRYDASTLRDNNGNKVPLDFKIEATAVVPRVVWVTDQHLLGGQLVFHALAPIVDLKVRAGGNSESKTGLGDVTVGTVLAYHASPNLHYVVGFDVNAPTGSYSKGDLANIGRNYWNIEPLFALSYVQPSGLNVDLKVMYDFNGRNSDTDYRSGQELHADYAVGWGLGNGWTVGVGGYVYQQVTNDRQAGATVPNNKGRALAIGPSVKFDAGKWLITAKYEREFSVRNRPEGGGFRIKAILPF